MPRVKTDLRINEEISTLSSKISDIEQQLREERKVQAKLLHEAETKVVQLNSLNEEIKSEAGRFSEASQQIIKETADIEQSNKAKRKYLNERKSELQHEISAFDIIEQENQYLHKTLQQLAIDYHNDALDRAAEREASKQRAFDARMTMEMVLRKEIQALDTNFKRRAIINLEEEANLARIENRELYTELSTRQELASDLIQCQQSSYDELQKAMIEHEVMQTAAETYEKHIASVQEMVEREERKKMNLQYALENMEYELNRSLSILQERMEMSQEMLKGYEDLKKAHNKKEKCRWKALKLGRSIVARSVAEAEAKHSAQSSHLANVDLDPDQAASKEWATVEWGEGTSSPFALKVNFPRERTSDSASDTVPNSNALESMLQGEFDPDCAWKTTYNRFPQISGTLRTAMIRDENRTQKEKKLPSTLPQYISMSMTNHNVKL